MQNYRYILGVDIGISSIGTGLVLLDEQGRAKGFLDGGVRLFEIPLGAQERRAKRRERRTVARRRQRVRRVRAFLLEHGLLPEDEKALARLMRRSPWHLRARGCREVFASLHELGRCLLHMAHFRGASFLSQMEEAIEEGLE